MRSANAYFLSVLLHGLVVALIFVLGYLVSETAPASPKVFELVAGAGDNYAATEAPALGAPNGLKLNLPTPPVESAPAPATPPAEMTPVPAEPAAPTETAPPEAVPVPAPSRAPTKTPTKPKPVNLIKSLKRTISRVTTKLEKKYKKEQEAERQRESYEEYQREHGAKSGSHARQLDAEGIRDGVIGGSAANKTGGAGGRALSREKGEELDAYFALLVRRIKENLVPPPDVSDKLEAGVEFYLAADGSISRVRIVQSSGSQAFDASVLEAFAHTRSIGPRPDGHGETVRLMFRLRDEDGG